MNKTKGLSASPLRRTRLAQSGSRRIEASRQGFTLTEVLIVIALVMLLFLATVANIRNQLSKAHDSQRKTDLNKMQKAMEEYYNDNQTYPPLANAFSNCASADLAPYLTKVLCDPITKQPYLYVLGTPTAKDGYVLCAKLENLSDPDITRIGCDPVKGCGWKMGYNYCIASGMLAIMPEWIANGGPTLTPTPTVPSGPWACSRGGVCNNYADPQGAGCPHTYLRGCINNGLLMCNDPANRCTLY